MEQYAELIMRVSGYAAAALAVLLLIRCAISMLQEKYDPEVWAYLELPDGSSRVLNNWECILGRARGADIVLRDKSVDRSHAALQRSARGKWVVYDLQGRGATYVNGHPVEDHARLRNGDTLRVGRMDLHFIDLSDAQRKTLQRRRAEPGRRVSPAVSLLLLTFFQLVLALQHRFTTPIEYRQAVLISFGLVIALEWCCFFAIRAFSIKGFEVETLAFFLSSVGLSVAASSDPSEMFKACALLLAGVGMFAILGWWLRDLRRVKALRWPLGFVALLFLGVNLLLSEEVFGAKNWLSIGGFSLQPSEFVKIAYIYAGASTLDRLFRRRNLLFFIGFSAVIVGVLALMGDFGTALVFFVCFLVVSFMRSGSFATTFLAISGAGLAGVLVVTVKPYVARRFATWGHAWEDPLGRGYQQVRAMSATASGGLFGQGAGRGWLHNVAAADTDLVFGMVCEELGLIVGFCCITAIILLALFTVRNASAGRSSYYVIAGCAAVTMMMTQVALNVFGSMDLLPFTGVTFPFVSRGGSSLISCWALLAYMKAGDTRQNASFALRSTSGRQEDWEEEDELEEEEFPEDEELPAAADSGAEEEEYGGGEDPAPDDNEEDAGWEESEPAGEGGEDE